MRTLAERMRDDAIGLQALGYPVESNHMFQAADEIDRLTRERDEAIARAERAESEAPPRPRPSREEVRAAIGRILVATGHCPEGFLDKRHHHDEREIQRRAAGMAAESPERARRLAEIEWATDAVLAAIDGTTAEAPAPAAIADRCERTGNPCGTDTWQAGRVCSCRPCVAYSYRQHNPEPPAPAAIVQVPRGDGSGYAWHAFADLAPADKLARVSRRSLLFRIGEWSWHPASSRAGERGRRGIYVASRASVPERAEMWRRLRSEGWPIVSSWIDEDGPGQTGDMAELWPRIAREVTGAAGLVLYVEQDDFPLKGALVEVGMSLATGVPVVVVAPSVEIESRTCRPLGSWMRHPLVSTAASVLDAFHQLDAIPASGRAGEAGGERS